MNCDQQHAAKDFVRTVQLSIDDLIYSESMVKERDSILRRFSSELMPILKLGMLLSKNILNYASYEPILRLAKSVEKELAVQISSLAHAEKCCGELLSCREDNENYILTSERICTRLTEDMRMTEISERLGCDYLRYMICLMEGAVRLAENALRYELCSAAVVPVRSVSRNCRELLHNMRKLLAVTE